MATRRKPSKANGDLAQALSAEGVTLSEEAVAAIIGGVAAAPPSWQPDWWLRLFAPHPSRALADALHARLDERRRNSAGGLGVSPAPAERLAALRAELRRLGVAGFVVPLADEHQGEFVAPRARRLAWLTGFTGSAGLAVVLDDKAALFVDGRYTLQAQKEVDSGQFAPLHLTETPPADWIADNLPADGALGYDPFLHTQDGVERLSAAAKRAGGRLAPLTPNPIDTVWTDQPPPPLSPAVPLPIAFAGRSAGDKLGDIADRLGRDGADAAVLTAPDSIAWLLNLRGGDIPNTPVAHGFAIVMADRQVALFIDARKVTEELRGALPNEVTLAAPADFLPSLAALGANAKRVLVDTGSAPAAVFGRLSESGATVVRGDDPCVLPKACKNATEIDGIRAAHRRDGAALSRFLAWLAREAPKGGVTELSAAAALLGFRKTGEHFRGTSFETISGAGPNGAIVHYRVDEKSNRRLDPGSVYLVDSGAQYLDGTTDVTRTVWIAGDGPPAAEIRDRFTRVLKGHIALALARFPKGTTGAQLDPFARAALWQAGIDYDHGTGHGVGAYLGVHEGPARISKQGGAVALAPGMVMSNEPGYYKTGAYGIRIENLVVVGRAAPAEGEERETYELETVTLAPIDRALIDPALLGDAERLWLDAYHARVRDTLTPLVDPDTQAWLAEATAPIGA